MSKFEYNTDLKHDTLNWR